EPHRPRLSKERGYFLMARPPLLSQGGEFASTLNCGKNQFASKPSTAAKIKCVYFPGLQSAAKNFESLVRKFTTAIENVKEYTLRPMLNPKRRQQFADLMVECGWDLLLLYGHSWRKD